MVLNLAKYFVFNTLRVDAGQQYPSESLIKSRPENRDSAGIWNHHSPGGSVPGKSKEPRINGSGI